MAELKAKISSINRIRMQTDGEGVTTLVAFSGCPIKCKYCINPSTWDGTDKNSRILSVDELYDELKIDHLYFISTGGGITFGGGEPLLQSAFIREFIMKYKEMTGWKFNCETSLQVPLENLKEVADCFDFYLVDTKDMDPVRYQQYTEGDYGRFRDNLEFLLKEAGPEKIRVRVPQIPYFHRNKEWEENALLLKKMGFTDINIFPYEDVSARKPISEASRVRARKQVEEFMKENKAD